MSGGWICGKCGASLAYWVSWCPCSPPVKPATDTKTTLTESTSGVTWQDCGCSGAAWCNRTFCVRRLGSGVRESM